MSSYHTSFSYLNNNSSAEGFMIAAFEADNGLSDTYLGMDQIYTDSYDGTHRHLYGTKYNSTATITISILKPDGSDLSVVENRKLLRWLTGSKKASWLDLYEGDRLAYSFFCTIQNVQQYKLDSRVVGLTITFESIHPWAWSAPQSYSWDVGEEMIQINDNGVIFKENSLFSVDDYGRLYNDGNYKKSFNYTDGQIYNNKIINEIIENKSDDLFTYSNLDLVFTNASVDDSYSTLFTFYNETLNETTTVTNIKPSEIIQLSANQFIVSNNNKRIFGDDFSWEWPRLAPGANKIQISVDGKGTLGFTYRYPIKIGDCALDIQNIIHNPMFEGEISGAISSTSGVTTLGRKNIILVDKYTNQTFKLFISNGLLKIAETTSSIKQYSFVFTDLAENDGSIPHEIAIICNRLYITTDNESISVNGAAHDHVVLVDEITNVPYRVTINTSLGENDRLCFVEI